MSGVLDKRQIRRRQRDAPAKHREGGIDMDTIIACRFSTLGQAQHCAERRPA
ncbi:hypothetical protein [Burkholderia cepacia]|uniref:hypothetical protein n=1 Tax=Burkholderia cepacia TaxID=292 RepID=UPI000A97892D|nr:hypothetical protein [Burkholderia cepacia]